MAVEWTQAIWDDLEAATHYSVEGDEDTSDYHGKQNVASEVVAALQELKEQIQYVWDNTQQ